jgi:3-dehydroquinate dehydratase/shikimate dehydrogenase
VRTTKPLLCVTVAAESIEAMRAARDAVDAADMVELRLDYLDTPDPAAALQGRRLPAIVTCRAAWEGGRFRGSEEERRRLLESAVSLGAEYVDVEAAAAFAPENIRSTGGRRVVVSRHDFTAPPRDAAARYRALRGMGAQVAKMAVATGSLTDCLPLLDLADQDDEPHVLLAMGAAGWPSRVLAARLGNCWTYAGDGIAPGQLPAERLLREFRFRRISSDAALFGVVGNPVGHSRSPVMHNAGFDALGINAAYLALEAASADDLAAFARALPLHGVSITAPFKIDLMAHVDEVDANARRVGAINTIVVREGRWIGANTDGEGFLAPLRGRLDVRGARATILGAGGAARAIAIALGDSGAQVTISARRPEAARAVADLVEGHVAPFPPRPGSWDLLVNATSPAHGGNGVSPMAGQPLDGAVVYDLIYEPLQTKLLEDARAAGCQTVGGIEMLAAQAERQYELWTGQRPPAGLFAAEAAAARRTAQPVSHTV